MSTAGLISWLLISWISFYDRQPTSLNNVPMQITPTAQPVLTYLVREPRVATTTRKAIILLHGVGSNETDLFGLADQLPTDLYVIAARGPYTLGPGRYAWYNVDFSSGRPVYDAGQEVISREHIGQFIADMKQLYKLDTIYLGGFSQGAIMSYSVGLTHPGSVQGIVALSGRLLEEIKQAVTERTALANLPVFIAHGIQDNTLPIDYGRSAKRYLDALHVPVSYHEYAMGHSINEVVLRDLNTWFVEH
jgi:phospholipase/carboxylesterase